MISNINFYNIYTEVSYIKVFWIHDLSRGTYQYVSDKESLKDFTVKDGQLIVINNFENPNNRFKCLIKIDSSSPNGLIELKKVTDEKTRFDTDYEIFSEFLNRRR